jgi:hypothetical protein
LRSTSVVAVAQKIQFWLVTCKQRGLAGGGSCAAVRTRHSSATAATVLFTPGASAVAAMQVVGNQGAVVVQVH